MPSVSFTSPANRADLLKVMGSNYTVKNVVIIPELNAKLKEARRCLQDEDVDFILTHFDTYYSVLHHNAEIDVDLVLRAFTDLQNALVKLNHTLGSILSNKATLSEATRLQTLEILRMLFYIFIEFVKHFEEVEQKGQLAFGKRPKGFAGIDKSKVIHSLGNVMQRPLMLFWDPPVAEHEFVARVAEVGLLFLQNPNVKTNKNFLLEIFGLFGNLISGYDYGKTFITRAVQSIRMYEHVALCVPPGIKLLAEQFNCKQYIVHHFVLEATDWIIDETYSDDQGAKHCAAFLTDLGTLLPELLVPEVEQLDLLLALNCVPLRNSVLNVYTEIVANVLNKHQMSDEERETRDFLLSVLFEHIRDVSGLVRARVFHNFARLQKDNVIPLKEQMKVLDRIVLHLEDKGALVRKAALHCLTIFLEHNPFAADLQAERTEQELQMKKETLEKMRQCYKEAQAEKTAEFHKEWEAREEELREYVRKYLDNDAEDEEEEEEEAGEVDHDTLVGQIGVFLRERDYKAALKIAATLKASIPQWKNTDDQSLDDKVLIYMTLLNEFYLNPAKINEEVRIGAGMTEDDVTNLEVVETTITYLEQKLEFLHKVNSGMEMVQKLLRSQTISDMQEAIQFIVTAYKFNMGDVEIGVFAMLKLMRHNDPDRNKAVLAACKSIYLFTNDSVEKHSTTIVERLISLVVKMPRENWTDFQSIVIEWTKNGTLDNSVIAKLWEYFTKRQPVSDVNSRVACELLRMAAIGRQRILTQNVALVASVAFGERGRKDFQLFAAACRLLGVVGRERVNVQSAKAQFRISADDAVFANMIDILVEYFDQDVAFYGAALQAGATLIFRACARPFPVVEKLILGVLQKTDQHQNSTMVLVRFFDLLGVCAVEMAEFLDNPVFREMKRRAFVREERKENENQEKKRGGKRKKQDTSMNASSMSCRDTSKISTATNRTLNSTTGQQREEAIDTEAEYILDLMENVVLSDTSGCFLPNYTGVLRKVLEQRKQYAFADLQLSATRTFMRLMLLSSKQCSADIRLLFTVFETSPYPEVKKDILSHLADLLTRYPNIIEPWSARIFAALQDPLPEIREVAFFCLANLILRDMIRAHGHLSEMAVSLVDEQQTISDFAKYFFVRMSHKDNLTNAIPDIFAHLVQNENVAEEKLRVILKFLFEQIDNTKKMDTLVERMCAKFTVNEDPRMNRNITYCLSLIEYNDRALKKLHESFPKYKHHVHDQEVYTLFHQILTETKRIKVGKADLNALAAEIEKCIASVFDVDKEGQVMPPPPVPSKKRPQQKGRKQGAKKAHTAHDDTFDEGSSVVTRRQSKRGGRKPPPKRTSDSGLESD